MAKSNDNQKSPDSTTDRLTSEVQELDDDIQRLTLIVCQLRRRVTDLEKVLSRSEGSSKLRAAAPSKNGQKKTTPKRERKKAKPLRIAHAITSRFVLARKKVSGRRISKT